MLQLIFAIEAPKNCAICDIYFWDWGAFPIDFATFIFAIHNIFLPENEHFGDS